MGEFVDCHPTLQRVLAWLADRWPPADMEITSIHRTETENALALAKTEIHVVGPPHRAIDLRVTNLPGDPQQAAKAIGALVNARYAYDPARPGMVVAFVEPHGTGPHVHLQVHDNTTLK